MYLGTWKHLEISSRSHGIDFGVQADPTTAEKEQNSAEQQLK